MTFKKGTTFSDGVEVKPLDANWPSVRIEMDLEGSGAIPSTGTAATTAAGYFLVRVITTAGSTVAGRVPFFNV